MIPYWCFQFWYITLKNTRVSNNSSTIQYLSTHCVSVQGLRIVLDGNISVCLISRWVCQNHSDPLQKLQSIIFEKSWADRHDSNMHFHRPTYNLYDTILLLFCWKRHDTILMFPSLTHRSSNIWIRIASRQISKV